MSDKQEFAGSNSCITSPQNNPPLGIKKIFDVFNDCQQSPNFLQFEDFGRESLGILDSNHPLFGRESLSFLSEDFGRESLGIINLNSLDLGRESLGIKSCDYIFSKANIPQTNNILNKTQIKESGNETLPEEFTFSINETCNSINSILNNAFLRPPTLSVSSSISSVNPSFHSASLGSSFLSRIFSTSSNSRTDFLNDAALWDTSDCIKRPDIFQKTSTSSAYEIEKISKPHIRINSLPAQLESGSQSFLGPPSPNNSDGFNDSVFMEANHLASRIADGSFLYLDDLGCDMLDQMKEPEDFDQLVYESPKCDTETVCKTLDRMFPPHSNDINNHKNLNITKTCEKSNNSVDKILLPSDDQTYLKKLNLSKTHDKSNTSRGSNNSKSKEAMEMISTLSEILNNDHPSEKQKSEGQHLLTSLAEILLSSASTKSRSIILDDSGHSSIESEPPVTAPEIPECYEVLDLRKKSTSESNLDQIESYEDCAPLDLSLKSKSSTDPKTFTSPKILPPKYIQNSKPLIKINLNKSVGSNCSNSSNESKNLSDLNNKFRPKKPETNSRKGPLKAVVPINNMARRKSGGLKVTPTRTDSKTSNHKLKKTSTPISETNLKPMAQSTPDNPRTSYVTSPLARPNKSSNSSPLTVKQRLNYSGTNLPIKNFDSKNKGSFMSRGSSGDLKKNENMDRPFVRSYSVGEKTGLPSRVKARQIASGLKRLSVSYSKTENSAALNENRIKSGPKVAALKKMGKENLH